MPKVDMVRTRHSGAELAAALKPELLALEGTDTMGAMMIAHIFAETANGDAIWNENVGNITTGKETDNYWTPSKGEASKLKFRVYPSLADGIRGYIGFLKQRPKMLEAARTGDTLAFSQRIITDGYNPAAPLEHTADQLLKLAAGKSALFSDLPKGPEIHNSHAGTTPSTGSKLGPALGVLLIVGGIATAAAIAYKRLKG